jgi:hypothetical protein
VPYREVVVKIARRKERKSLRSLFTGPNKVASHYIDETTVGKF